MARICSFEIEYKQRSFPTLVTVLNTEHDVVCTVHFVERQIRYLEPGDKLVYCKEQGLKQPQNIPPELLAELNRCIQRWLLESKNPRA